MEKIKQIPNCYKLVIFSGPTKSGKTRTLLTAYEDNPKALFLSLEMYRDELVEYHYISANYKCKIFEPRDFRGGKLSMEGLIDMLKSDRCTNYDVILVDHAQLLTNVHNDSFIDLSHTCYELNKQVIVINQLTKDEKTVYGSVNNQYAASLVLKLSKGSNCFGDYTKLEAKHDRFDKYLPLFDNWEEGVNYVIIDEITNKYINIKKGANY